MLNVTPTTHNVLEALALYRYMTPAQMLSAGVTKDRSHLYENLRRLSRGQGSPIGAMDFGTLAGHGRLPVVYYLKKKGAEILADATQRDNIEYTKHRAKYHNDYFHRIDSVDSHIIIRKWAAQNEIDIDFFRAYYEHRGANHGGTGERLQALTTVWTNYKRITPDAIFKFTTPDGASRLCVLEISRRMETKRVTEQLARHLEAFEDDSFGQAFKYPHMHRLLWVFDSKNALERVQERALTLPTLERWQKAIFFKTLDDVKSNFLAGWQSPLANSISRPRLLF